MNMFFKSNLCLTFQTVVKGWNICWSAVASLCSVRSPWGSHGWISLLHSRDLYYEDRASGCEYFWLLTVEFEMSSASPEWLNASNTDTQLPASSVCPPFHPTEFDYFGGSDVMLSRRGHTVGSRGESAAQTHTTTFLCLFGRKHP